VCDVLKQNSERIAMENKKDIVLVQYLKAHVIEELMRKFPPLLDEEDYVDLETRERILKEFYDEHPLSEDISELEDRLLALITNYFNWQYSELARQLRRDLNDLSTQAVDDQVNSKPIKWPLIKIKI
jgi:uncharacterized protein YutD